MLARYSRSALRSLASQARATRPPMLALWRGFSSSEAPSEGVTFAFDREMKLLQRDGAARSHKIYRDQDDEAVNYDYFRSEIANRLVERLDDIKRDEGFPLALDIGSGPGFIHRVVCSDDGFEGEGGGIGGIRKLVQLDSATDLLHRDVDVPVEGQERCGTYRMHSDEEAKPLPFPDGTFDLVISSTAMHWVNDIPGLFAEVKRVLKPDGCFLFSMVGGTSLPELSSSLALAEMEREGGFSPHLGPFVQVSDVGMLLQRAGFALPTIDVDTIQIGYPDAMVLMEHLQRMGEGNASVKRRPRTPLDTFLAAACIYDEEHSIPNEDMVQASVQVIYAIGWTPHESQPQPKERGSAKEKLSDNIHRIDNE